MKKLALLASLTLISVPAMADRLACEDLKSQIDAKLQAKGVKNYTLDIVSADSLNASAEAAPAKGASAPSAAPAAAAKASDVKVVGSCDGGAKRITYKRG